MVSFPPVVKLLCWMGMRTVLFYQFLHVFVYTRLHIDMIVVTPCVFGENLGEP